VLPGIDRRLIAYAASTPPATIDSHRSTWPTFTHDARGG